MKLFIQVFIIYFTTVFCFSQSAEINFTHISPSTKISNGWVRCIYQDEKGFIWAGTVDGLNRYDGYEFKTYRPRNKKNQELGNIEINSISKKNDHQLWIGTSSGVYTYDYKNDQLTIDPILETIAILHTFEDHEKNTWFSTENGLYRIDSKNGEKELFIHDPNNLNSISNDFIYLVFEDSDYNLWIGTQKGLNRYNKNTNSFIRYSIFGQYQEAKENVMSIAEDQQKRMWIGTTANGYYVLKNKESNNFELINDGFITDLIVDKDNILWVTKGSNGGLDKININDLKPESSPPIENFTYDASNYKSIRESSLYTVYEDRSGDIWIGAYGKGLNYYSKREKKIHRIQQKPNTKNTIQNNLITAILEQDKYIWFGTEGGIDRYDKTEKTYKHFQYYSNKPSTLGGNAIFCLAEDSRGNLWAGTWGGGLNRYDSEKETFEQFFPTNLEGSISSPNIFSVVEDRNHNLWVGTIGGGLNKYDYETKTFTHYRHDPDDPNSMISDYIEQIIELKNGNLYLSAYYEIQRFDVEKNIFHKYFFNKDGKQGGSRIVLMYEDSNNNIWIGTNVGLYLFDEKSGAFTPYLASEKLNNKTIQGILDDDKGNLWLSTNDGIFQIIEGTSVPEKPLIHHYRDSDGLSGNEFKKRAAYKSRSGRLYFGSSQGATWFNPEVIKSNKELPKVALTEFQLLYNDSDKSKIYKSAAINVNVINKLDLSYKESDFIIKYASLNYLHPEKNSYQYKLEGHDEQWIDSEGKRSVTYTNIQPGNYTFMVKAANNDGLWNETPKTLNIHISPPWWGTYTFKALVAFLIIGSVFLLYIFRISFLKSQNNLLEVKVHNRTNELTQKNELLKENSIKIIAQKEELEKHRSHLEQLVEGRTKELLEAKKKAEESDRLKSSFMTNMSHEIRTPMNAIYGFSSLLDDESLTVEDRNKYIGIIKNNCDSLLLLIDNILDISLIEAKHLTLTPEKFDINDQLKELEDLSNKNNSDKDISITFENDQKEKPFFIYSDLARFRQIFTNLLNNAYKFTQEGEIKFGYTEFDEYLQFYVSDTGIGIEASKIAMVFEPFLKIENEEERLYEGTGIGLAICKRLIDQLDGTIWLNSMIKKGSTFYFTIPKVRVQ